MTNYLIELTGEIETSIWREAHKRYRHLCSHIEVLEGDVVHLQTEWKFAEELFQAFWANGDCELATWFNNAVPRR